MTINRHIYAYFEDSTAKTGKTGLADVTFTVKSVKHSDSSIATVVNGVVGFEVGLGIYAVLVSGMDYATYDYLGYAVTASTAVTSKAVPALRWDAAEAHDTELANLDAAISSRSTLAAGAQMDLVNAPNATAVTAIQSGLSTLSSSDVASSVLDATASAYNTSGTIGEKINASSALGSGAISCSVTVNDGANPLDGVDVWVTTDLAGTNVIARGDTNDSGVVTFMLDAGTYYAWKQLAGYSFANPESFTVS